MPHSESESLAEEGERRKQAVNYRTHPLSSSSHVRARSSPRRRTASVVGLPAVPAALHEEVEDQSPSPSRPTRTSAPRGQAASLATAASVRSAPARCGQDPGRVRRGRRLRPPAVEAGPPPSSLPPSPSVPPGAPPRNGTPNRKLDPRPRTCARQQGAQTQAGGRAGGERTLPPPSAPASRSRCPPLSLGGGARRGGALAVRSPSGRRRSSLGTSRRQVKVGQEEVGPKEVGSPAPPRPGRGWRGGSGPPRGTPPPLAGGCRSKPGALLNLLGVAEVVGVRIGGAVPVPVPDVAVNVTGGTPAAQISPPRLPVAAAGVHILIHVHLHVHPRSPNFLGGGAGRPLASAAQVGILHVQDGAAQGPPVRFVVVPLPGRGSPGRRTRPA